MTASTLVEFLLARLDEDEAVAAEVPLARGTGHTLWVLEDDYNHATLCVDPARVLAEVAAKRRTIELHHHRGAREHECPAWKWRDPDYPEDPAERETGWAIECVTIRLLALPYAEHEAYRQEWAP